MAEETQTAVAAAASAPAGKQEPKTPQAEAKVAVNGAGGQANKPMANGGNKPQQQNGGNKNPQNRPPPQQQQNGGAPFRPNFVARNVNSRGFQQGQVNNNNNNNKFQAQNKGFNKQPPPQQQQAPNNFNKNKFQNGQQPNQAVQQRQQQQQQNESATTSKSTPSNEQASNHAQKRDHATANGYGGNKGPHRPYNSMSNLHSSSSMASNVASSSGGSGSSSEKKFTGRCRLFVGNLPNDIDEAAFKELFAKFGEVGECFLNTARGFAFVKLDTRINAEHAKQELDGIMYKGRAIRVRFASHGAAVKVKNLSPYVSNEYLEQAFSIFGPVERAVVIVDDKGRPTGDGIIEFERKPAATQCLNKCTDGYFVLTSYPKPVVVEPLEQKDDEDGLPEKSIIKNNQYYNEREVEPHFVHPGSIEHKLAMRWRELYELEKKIQEDGKKQLEHAREMLEYEIDQALIDHKAMKIKEDLRMKQEELQRIEDMRKSELQRRQEMELRRQEEDRRRQEESMHYNRHQDMGMQQQQRGNNNNHHQQQNGGGVGGMDMRQMQFDPSMLNQQQQAAVLAAAAAAASSMAPNNNGGGGGGGNRQGGGGANGANNALNSGQQQAMLAQLSALAMVAAQGMPNGLFDAPPQIQQQQQQQQGHLNNHNNKGGMNMNRGDDHRNTGPRRQLQQQFHDNRRGGGGRGGHQQQQQQQHRDDSYPGYDNKRPRY